VAKNLEEKGCSLFEGIIQVTNFVVPEPEGSSPYLQEPVTVPCAKPSECTVFL
jgi:hypothetical protein